MIRIVVQFAEKMHPCIRKSVDDVKNENAQSKHK